MKFCIEKNKSDSIFTNNIINNYYSKKVKIDSGFDLFQDNQKQYRFRFFSLGTL